MDNIKIVEINLFKLNNPFMRVKLFGKTLSKEGYDWIKFICLRTWAKKNKNSIAKYELPKLFNNHKYSSNKYLNEAIIELILGNQILLSYYKEAELAILENRQEAKEEGRVEGREEGIKLGDNKVRETQLTCAYYLFHAGQELDNFPLEFTYKIDDINAILEKKVDSKILNEEDIKKFIDALKKKMAIID